MQEMVEPDRTILIVSIIGLVVIWGSVAYHRFVQGGAAAAPTPATEPVAEVPHPGALEAVADDAGEAPAERANPAPASPAPAAAPSQKPRGKRRKGKKRR